MNLRKGAEKQQDRPKGITSAPPGHTASWQNINPNGIEPSSQTELPDRDVIKPDVDLDGLLYMRGVLTGRIPLRPYISILDMAIDSMV